MKLKLSRITLIVLTLASASLTACGSPPPVNPPTQGQNPKPSPAPNPGTARPFHMVGVVKNSQGKPLANVRVGADNTVLDGSELWTVTDGQGRYDLDLSNFPLLNSWTATANLAVNYHGQSYTLYPEVDTPAPFLGQDGAARNFTLKLTGRSSGGGYHGALLYANFGLSEAGEMPEFSDVEYHLEPDGPLIDGTTGDSFTLKWAQLPFEVPQGSYTVTARSLSGKGPLWLKARGGAYGPSATVDMEYTAGTGMTLSVDIVHPHQ